MNFTGLYELIERFHRSNQLPAFVFGALSALAITFLFLWKFRLRIRSSGSPEGEIRALEKQVADLSAENKRHRSDLDHYQKHADVLKSRLFELTGGLQGQKNVTAVLSAECEHLKQKLLKKRQDQKYLSDRHQLAKRIIVELKSKLKAITLSNGRIWEAAPGNGAAPFRPLSQRRTPVLSLVNLKGGVGKTTIAANLAVAMNKHGCARACHRSRSSKLAFPASALPCEDGRAGRLAANGSHGAPRRDRRLREFSSGDRACDVHSELRDFRRGRG